MHQGQGTRYLSFLEDAASWLDVWEGSGLEAGAYSLEAIVRGGAAQGLDRLYPGRAGLASTCPACCATGGEAPGGSGRTVVRGEP